MLQNLKDFRDPDYSNHPAYGLQFSSPPLNQRIRAMKHFFPLFLKNLLELMRRRNKWAVIQNDRGRLDLDSFRELYDRGITAMRVSAADKERLVGIAAPFVSQLRKLRETQIKASSYQENNLKLREKDAPELFALVKKILGDLNVFELAKAYHGYSVGVNTVCVQINDVNDLYWTNHFSDVKLPDPPTSYMHVDSSVGYLKSIFYLNEVTEENGCFRYVIGSHLILKRKLLDFAIRRANDMSKLDKTDPDHRKLFSALPSFFQRKAEMGNDYLERSPIVNTLQESELLCTSKLGDLVLFDTDGIHRGAIVKSGERIILQVALVPHEHIKESN